MKVLVVGGGGREHALAWKIASSPLVTEVLCAPGNAGTANVGRNVPVRATDLVGIVELALAEAVDLVVVGPEDPLCAGLVDRLSEKGILAFGPGASGARIEGSKLFAKEILDRHRIPTAAWRRFDRAGTAKAYLEQCTTWPQVVKANGLAAGKGVFVCADAVEACSVVDSLMEKAALGDAGREIVIEEFLQGEEVSVHAITDGRTLLILEPVVDHKQVGEGDTGPNTGGMGVVSPSPLLSARLMRQVEQRVLLPTLHALRIDDIPFRGALFVGLMITEAGPRVLEFNARFGDPETQAILRRLKSDLVPYLVAAASGELEKASPPEWTTDTCVGVVAASEGYPGSYEKGHRITGLDAAEEEEEVVVFHAGTRLDGGVARTDGGRVLCVTALGKDKETARKRAYAGYDHIHWSGKFCRRDIGERRGGATSADTGRDVGIDDLDDLSHPGRPGGIEPATSR
jgi:phosphoribosylamine--glycine ligase